MFIGKFDLHSCVLSHDLKSGRGRGRGGKVVHFAITDISGVRTPYPTKHHIPQYQLLTFTPLTQLPRFGGAFLLRVHFPGFCDILCIGFRINGVTRYYSNGA